jgi:hypothetical protein
MDRGIVCCYPMVRGKVITVLANRILGTKYFDDDWFFSGIAERKLTHMMDFIDVAVVRYSLTPSF